MNKYNEEQPIFDAEFISFMFFFIGNIFLFYNCYKAYTFYNEESEEEFNLHIKPENETKIVEEEEEVKHRPIPYEEKYLIRVRAMKNEYVFTEEELKLKEQKMQELEKTEKKEQLELIYSLNEKIEELTIKLAEITPTDEDVNSKKDNSLIVKINDSIKNEINMHEKKLLELREKSINMHEIEENALQYVIDEQLKKFKKKYVIEHTPLGNVLLFYNHDKLAFEYYSDLTIPYRYLETVARKYVLTYNYRPLYIDMEEELKEYERKLENKEAKEKLKTTSQTVSGVKTKDVFAKFKSYNKEAGTGRVNTAPPPKNSIPQARLVNVNSNNNNDKILLKENANRYSYQGKFVNFNILQKIDKKAIDKKYTLTFADFKKMNKT
jgi:hypothetical protein